MLPPRTSLLACALPLLAGAPSAQVDAPTDVAAFHRSGQTFLTWSEVGPATGESYRIYRADAPIDAASIGSATRIDEVWEDSSRFYADRWFKTSTLTWQPRYVDRFVVDDGGPELDAGTGLYVITLRESDFGGASSGTGYYAVTSVDASGIENLVDVGAANTTGPLAEAVDLPLPVLTATTGAGGFIEVYTQFVDARGWNVTFDAPTSWNDWYGLSPAAPEIQNAIQYAYTYAVIPPYPGGCPAPPGPRPVVVQLHRHGGTKSRPQQIDPEPTHCEAFRILPLDVNDTWWFGNARDHDYRVSTVVEPGDVIENFTEQRVLRMLLDLSRHPAHGADVDLSRVYVMGHSMGGSGTVAFALRYPDLFAAALADKPMTDYEESGSQGGFDWVPDAEVKWGAPVLDLPVALRGPLDWAAHLAAHDGSSVWDWQDHQLHATTRRADEMVPLGVRHSIDDSLIDWATQGVGTSVALEGSDRAWAGEITQDDHAAAGWSGLLPPGLDEVAGVPFSGFDVVLGETLPALTDAGTDPAIPPVGTGGYHRTIEWSSSWNDWDGAPLDAADAWAVSLRTVDGSTTSVDVTPRRTAAFAPAEGERLLLEVEAVADGAALRTGLVVVDPDGLATVTGVNVDPSGVRVRLTRLDSAASLTGAPAAILVADGGAHDLVLNAGGDQAGRLYLCLGSSQPTSAPFPGLPVGGFLLPLFVPDAWFTYTLTSPNGPGLVATLGVTGPDGAALAAIDMPPNAHPALPGLTFHHAYLVFDPFGAVDFASVAVDVAFE